MRITLVAVKKEDVINILVDNEIYLSYVSVK